MGEKRNHPSTTSRYQPVRQNGRVVGFKVLSEECIWMRAGVVNFRYCDNAYDCSTCAFDKGMRRALASRKRIGPKRSRPPSVHWAASLRNRYSGMDKPCRHVLTGRVQPPKSCPLNYECHHCAFDQWVEDTEEIVQSGNRPTCRTVSGVSVAEAYYYHPGHTWIRCEHGGRLRVGMDALVAHLFGALDAIELPALGSDLTRMAEAWRIHRKSRSAGVMSPVSGTVVALNPVIADHPEMPHHDPYQYGWLMLVESPHPKRSLKHLMIGKAAVDWMETETQGMMDLLGEDYAELAATGGRLVRDLVGRVTELDWDQLVRRFLHTQS